MAASDGTVTAAGPASGYGQWVKLSRPGGISTVDGHASAWTVTVGLAVQVGQVIAHSGHESRSSGRNLHCEVGPGHRPFDMIDFFAASGQAPW